MKTNSRICSLHGNDLRKGIAEPLVGYPSDEILKMNSLFPFNGIYEILGCLPVSGSNEGQVVTVCDECKKQANEYLVPIKKRWEEEQKEYDRLEAEGYEEDQR